MESLVIPWNDQNLFICSLFKKQGKYFQAEDVCSKPKNAFLRFTSG